MWNTVECIFEVKANLVSLVINTHDHTKEHQQLSNCELRIQIVGM